MQKRKKRKIRFFTQREKKSMVIITLLCIIICGAFGYNTKNLKEKTEEYNLKYLKVEEELEKEQKRQKELASEEEYRKTTEYIEEMAKSKLGLVNPDEQILIGK